MRSPLRLSTPRRADRPTTGTQSAVLAELAGIRLQPWQRHVLDVAGELIPNPDPNPRPDHPALVHAYSTVSVSVGRRAGKSVLTFARALRTAGTGGFGYYTAQNGAAASAKFRNDWTPLLQRAPYLAGEFRVRLSNGSETIRHTQSGGYTRIFSPVPQSLHGDSADWVAFDESWSFTPTRGRELEVAAYPLTATRPGAQVWTLSAAGDVGSTWWHDTVNAGREAAQLDAGTGHCHLEWSAHGLDDLDDPATWELAHPAVRSDHNPHGMVTVDYLKAEHERDPDQFRRSWLNLPDTTGEGSAPIDPETWDTLACPPRNRVDTMTIGIAVAPEQTAAAVVVCYIDNAGTPVLEVDTYRAGTDWVVDRVVDLTGRYDVPAVSLDAAGQSPAVVLRRPLEFAGVGFTAATLPDVTASAAELVAAVRHGRIRHVRHPALDLAAYAARRRPIGDGSWAFGLRNETAADISPIVAATHALWVNPDAHNAPYAAIS